jgi:hypothetical protein
LRDFSAFNREQQKQLLAVLAVVDLDLFCDALDLIFEEVEQIRNLVEDILIDQAAAELLSDVDLNL